MQIVGNYSTIRKKSNRACHGEPDLQASSPIFTVSTNEHEPPLQVTKNN